MKILQVIPYFCFGGAETTLFSPVGGGLWGDWVRRALTQADTSE